MGLLAMRLSEQKIREAILYPEEEVRLTALSYFTDTFSRDATIMPLIVKAVEKYGRDKAFRILRCAERLAQTPLTIEWLVNELCRDVDVGDDENDNYRFAIAILLYEADPELLAKRPREILELPSFPDELKGPLDERLKMHFWDWTMTWAALEELGQDTMENDEISQTDLRRFHRILGALAHHRDQHGDQILGLVRRQYKRDVRPLMEWLEPWIVKLTGMMRLEEAIPYLMRRLDEGYESVVDEVGPALSRIGTDAVIQAVNRKWRRANDEIRSILCDPLEHIHTDFSAERSLTLLNKEDAFEVALDLGHAALSHYTSEAIDSVRELVLCYDEELTPDQWDLRWKLVAACTIMGASFTEYRAWHGDALANNYGWGDHRHERVRDAFRDSRV